MQLGLVPIEVNKLVTNKLDYHIMENINNKEENKALSQDAVSSRFSVGDKVNYCNGLIFKIVSINDKCGTCYDSRGMWYALSNCVKIS